MATVEEDCWHGKVSSREAERRLVAVNKTNAYLFRESDIKRNKFILSYISDKTRGLFKHLIVPAPSKKGFSSVCDAFSVMDKMVVSNADNAEEAVVAVVEENETKTIETVEQVLHSK